MMRALPHPIGRHATPTGRRCAARHRAFTLIEMMVSLAVLTLALSIVGVVFTVTTRTVNQAAAYSEAQSWVRQFTLQMEEDLAYVAPSESVLVLVGRRLPAALTADDLAARRYHCVLVGDPSVNPGYDPALNGENSAYSNPRADILMFFTNRPTYSAAPAPTQANIYHAGTTKLSPIQVVYGHAAFADAISGNGMTASTIDPNSLRHIDNLTPDNRLSAIPADQWDLARRAVIIEPLADGATIKFSPADWNRILTDQTNPPPPASGRWAGDVAALDLNFYLAQLGPRSTLGCPQLPAQMSPYGGDPSILGLAKSILYPGGAVKNHHIATIVQDPPVDLRTNAALQMLPACAWFQVEFLMPEDPRNSLDYRPALGSGVVPAGVQERRWTSVANGSTYVFVPDTSENRAAVASQAGIAGKRVSDFISMNPSAPVNAAWIADKRIRMWPYAIRVTVQVYDPHGRLTDPIVRSVVHRFD